MWDHPSASHLACSASLHNCCLHGSALCHPEPRVCPLPSCAPGVPCAPSATAFCASTPLHPAGWLTLSCLLVWMNVSILTPSLLDFHTVQFSVSSGDFVSKLLLSLSWLCKEAQHVYLCLHLGWKYYFLI
ncbi:hypothetical protein HJG60_009017 [Phyllostomus discolor]|uniref:Uncharacterized protein n=1 Tax=Phyllostomus discolor TaxID=89673 RepID=A0A833YRZ4_9CHIR|nr:hypothetical protein HJG60_009017 [Phyllostomus discolor]